MKTFTKPILVDLCWSGRYKHRISGGSMFVNWDEVQKALSPIKDYKDLCLRLNKSFSYPIVRRSFNFTLPQLITYSGQLLGGDARQRYTEYLDELIRILRHLAPSGVG